MYFVLGWKHSENNVFCSPFHWKWAKTEKSFFVLNQNIVKTFFLIYPTTTVNLPTRVAVATTDATVLQDSEKADVAYFDVIYSTSTTVQYYLVAIELEPLSEKKGAVVESPMASFTPFQV